MNELFLRIAIDDIHRETDHQHINGTPSAQLDADNHISRMQRLISWPGTALGAGAKPAHDRVVSLPAVAPAPA